MARVAPVRSLRDGTRAQALRRARTCYDHLAGQLGVAFREKGGGRDLGHCIDWTEQRHHLSGRVGRALNDRFLQLGWIRRGPIRRSILVTDAGRQALEDQLGIGICP